MQPCWSIRKRQSHTTPSVDSRCLGPLIDWDPATRCDSLNRHRGHKHNNQPPQKTSDQTARQGVLTGRMHTGHRMSKGDAMNRRWSPPDPNTNTAPRKPRDHSQVLRIRAAMMSGMATPNPETPLPETCWKRYCLRNFMYARNHLKTIVFSSSPFDIDSRWPQSSRL
jgi:hypothetical protein